MLITAADIWPGPVGAAQWAGLGGWAGLARGYISGSQPAGPTGQEATVSHPWPVLRLARPGEYESHDPGPDGVEMKGKAQQRKVGEWGWGSG